MTSMSESRLRNLFLDTKGLSLEELEGFGTQLLWYQAGVHWWIGDVARYAEARFPDTWQQAFPACVSPGLISRCAAVARAYPREEDRNPLASWAIHMQNASRPDRIARVQAHVDAGRTSDEAREADKTERASRDATRSWLLAFDTHYYVHRHYHSGAGVETAMQVSEWIQRTVERLKLKGATDVVCAFEGQGSFRRELTAGDAWADERYKDRPPKPEDLRHQLRLSRDLLEKMGFCCVSVDGYEADDVLASYAKQFPGRVTIISSDKDLRSCLSAKCNILLDVTWKEDDTSGEHMADYKWLTAKTHTEETGIPPERWVDYQSIMGDACDGIRGVEGIGQKGAADLIKALGTVEAVIQAAKDGVEFVLNTDGTKRCSLSLKKREAIIAFESKRDVTRRLVTLVDTLTIPNATRIV